MRPTYDHSEGPFAPLPPRAAAQWSMRDLAPARAQRGNERPGAAPSKVWTLPNAAHSQNLKWAAAGFTAGAIFWHFVGFWTFMSQIMFTAPQSQRQAQAPGGAALTHAEVQAPSSKAGAPIETGSIRRLEKLTTPKTEPNFTVVSLHRRTQQTRQAECPKLARPLTVKATSARQDREMSAPPAVAAREALAPPQEFALDPSLPLEWPAPATGR